MTSEHIPFALPDIDEKEIESVVGTLKSGWLTSGPKVIEFENSFKDFVNSKYAVSVNSATAGLHLALDAIGLEAGDFVVTTAYTFTATAEVVRYFDATPILCDINPKTLNICPQELDKLLSKICVGSHKVKAIIPVHIAGQACDMKPILELAKKYDLKVIEDAAHALPTTYNRKMIGSLSDLTVFSFYATKTLCTGEGGMVTTNNESYKKRIECMRLHGFNRNAWDRYQSKQASWYYEIVAPGYKYNMTDSAAAIGLEQLKKINIFHNRRTEVAQIYTKEFASIDGINVPYIENNDDKHAYHLYIIHVGPSKRDLFIEKMKDQGVSCSVHFIPLHYQPYWKEKYELNRSDFPNASQSFESAVSLPIYTKLTDHQVGRVVQAVKTVSAEIL